MMSDGVSESDVVLVVDDEVNIRKVLGALLKRNGYEVHTAADGAEALGVLDRVPISVVVTDLRMPEMDGMALLRGLQERRPDIPVLILTAYGTVDRAVEAIKAGAFDFITKPFDRAEIKRVIAKAAQQYRLNQRDLVCPASDEATGRFGMVGATPSMRALFQLIERVSDTPATVLVTGESGTGKELVARAMHEHSSRARQPYIRVNCAAIPRDLVESELFGHERGAFTGAVTSKPGRFELAHRGTLFLDEVGEIPLEMQVKLLRAIQEGAFERVGGVRTLSVDVRLVAATNQDLQGLIAAGRFREDLFYRLNVVPILIPPLRDRREDIPPLVRHAAARAAQRLGRPVPVFDDDAVAALQRHGWPGNIRELENVVERVVLLSDAKVFGMADLPPEVLDGLGAVEGGSVADPTRPEAAEAPELGAMSLKDAVRQGRQRIERELIARALEETGQNVTRAAQLLGISRKSLQIKMKDLGFRDSDDE